ncbi:hypothetical protein BH23CHL4_BH23CHL4_25370 [soil metagenome]
MTIADTLRNNRNGMTSFWLLVPNWLRRLPRHCEGCGGTTFLLDKDPRALSRTNAGQVLRVELPLGDSLIERLRDGGLRR